MKTRSKSAFTLIELLVVVSILALLLGILIPSLSRSKDSARAASCASNQHQVAQAWSACTASNKGRAPFSALWTGELMPYMNSKQVLLCGNAGAASQAPHNIIDSASLKVFSGGNEKAYSLPLVADTYTRMLSEEQYQAWRSGGFGSNNPPPSTYVEGANPNIVYYAFEDLRGSGNDWDFEDIILRIIEQPDGTVSIERIYDGAGYTFQMAIGPMRLDFETGWQGKVWPLKGYRSSFAVNLRAEDATRAARGKTILSLDFAKTITLPDEGVGDDWDQWIEEGKYVFARHMDGVNVSCIDGSVQRKNTLEIHPRVNDTGIRAKYIRREMWGFFGD